MGIVEKWAVRWNKRTMWKEKRKGYGEMNESRGRKSGRKVKKSLKMALFMYIVAGIVAIVIACILILNYFERWQEMIRTTAGFTEKEVLTALHTVYTLETTRVSDEVIRQLAILDMVQMFSVFICIVLGIVIVSRLYYKKKLELPLEILKLEIECIGRDDLNFDCSYYSGDEMEEICTAFNHMRLQLIKTQGNLWKLLEKQRELNAAFAHDIRTPVTVMKGYSQMLLKFYPEGKISEEKLLETLQMIDRQADRLERFSDTMKEIHSLDEWQIEKKITTMKELMEKLSANLKGMAGGERKTLAAYDGEGEQTLYCDMHLIEEVADNLFANGFRHAKETVELKGSICEGTLYLYVKDDGAGFSGEAQERAMRPYFTTDKEHFGMGLTICKTLCGKHGGDLAITNSIDGGAIVCAMFDCQK